MTNRKCVVPSCSYRNRKNYEEKRSMFQCPKDEQKARRWASNIPGIEILTPYQLVCEKHFESKFIRRYFEKNSNVPRSRLVTDAVPTIFSENNNTSSNNSNSNYKILTAYLDNNKINYQTKSTNVESTLQDIVKDLSASEQLLLTIKQEMFQFPEDEPQRIKSENLEDHIEQVKEENSFETKELTVYEQLQKNFNYYAKLLPESWSISQLPIGNDKVFAFSKECTVSENEALVVMYEKNIVLNSSGDIHYSIHGKTLNKNHPYTPNILKDVGSLLDIISKFDAIKVCQGILTSEFEVDKDCVVYKDDLGYCRHTNCILITDKEQCNSCYEYSQYLLTIMINNIPVFNNGPFSFYDQVY
ncbi:PREDICTED: uncharacterized protein LOC105363696 [Ceratosolen solmsi marchali]|uniref:Uncharacterized protein LOC105363696 n=1 Tax=Ceratosolen solmsi marchali TaxID=326594 RepID=A0AAJ6YKI8_9HYME|nr:PREDICTED: uncharacterized protein LOC105363696 [Ceratosolen solmsi marchali]